MKLQSMIRGGILASIALLCQSQDCLDARPAVAGGCPFLAIRSVTGECNNMQDSAAGATLTTYDRMMPQAFAYDRAPNVAQQRGSARRISNRVMHQDASVPSATATTMTWVWGQFLDHDLVRTLETGPEMNIPVRDNDIFVDLLEMQSETGGARRLLQRGGGGNNNNNNNNNGGGNGNGRGPRDRMRGGANRGNGNGPELHFVRSALMCDEEGNSQQFNNISHFIDASNVYSSDPNTANDIREHVAGRLAMSGDQLLPLDPNTLELEGGPFFLAGDDRSNEQTSLTAMHTLWVREHNRIAAMLIQEMIDDGELNNANQCTDDCDEGVYQAARMRVVALIQKITYDEYLTALLGPDAIDPWTGYDDDVDPQISNSFSAAVYRFGHSMVNSVLLRLEEDFETPLTTHGHLSLLDAFFTPAWLRDPQYGGIEPIMRGLVAQAAENVDLLIVDELRNGLFNTADDLVSRNVQRGRDHSLPTYNDACQAMGMPTAGSFNDINPADPDVGERLRRGYDDVDDIDLFVGGLAEAPCCGGSVGHLFNNIMADQFTRLRDGDRFWYQESQVLDDFVRGQTLADVIARNSRGLIDRNDLPDNVFVLPGASNGPGGNPIPPPPGPGPQGPRVRGTQGGDRQGNNGGRRG